VTRPGLAHHEPFEEVSRMHPNPTRPMPEPALHLLGGIWIASCPTCGFQLATARTQPRCERRATRRLCPVCHQEGR
jgi:hypothetical protein